MNKLLEQSLRVYPSIHKYDECSCLLIKDMKIMITKCIFSYNKFLKVIRTIMPNGEGKMWQICIYFFS